MNRQRGFSLMELMIVIVIVTILTLIAVPIYKGVQERARRTQAVNALQTLATREEGYFGRYNIYASSMTALGYSSASNVLTDGGGYYAVSILAADATTYKLEAVPQATGGQDQDKCGTFELDSLGQKSVTGSANVNDCWH